MGDLTSRTPALRYSSLSYFLHAVHVETGSPLFAHQLVLGFLPECLDYDAQSRRVVAVARSTAGVAFLGLAKAPPGVHAVVLCPSCAESLVKARHMVQAHLTYRLLK